MFKDGIFICDTCRPKLLLSIEPEIFEAMKEEIKGDTNLKNCYLCNTEKYGNEGLHIPKKKMGEALQKSIDVQELTYNNFKNKIYQCSCGNELNNTVTCNKCLKVLNLKEYEKKIKLPFAKKIAIRIFIKSLMR